jgi:hypothetical protein
MVEPQAYYQDICIDGRGLLPVADSTVKSFNPFILKGVNFLYPYWLSHHRRDIGPDHGSSF